MFRFKPVSGLHFDMLRCTGWTSLPGAMWRQVDQEGKRWAAGDWEIKWQRSASGRRTAFTAWVGSDGCWSERVTDTPLTEGLTTEVTITRIDLCRDVVGFPVAGWLVHYFAGTRGASEQAEDGTTHPFGTHEFIASPSGNTLYIGAREGAACFLRIYEKFHPEKTTTALPERLTREWKVWGWAGEPVTRIEYELKREGVVRCMDGRQSAWNDSLARIRLIVRPRHEYKRPANARSHIDWRKLGAPEKVRVPSAPEPPLLEKLTRSAEQAKRRARAAGLSMKDYLRALQYLAVDGVSVTGDDQAGDFEVRGKRGQVIRLSTPHAMGDLDGPEEIE